MQIISHRGYWKSDNEKNTEQAFRRSLECGFGIETDLRDLNGDIVVSHDMPLISNSLLTLSEFFEIYVEYEKLPLALNIKSDGLQDKIIEKLTEYKIENYVLFDMSIPDQILTLNKKLKFLCRASEYEEPKIWEKSEGFWADEFDIDWIDKKFIEDITHKNKNIFIVSPELHGRNHLSRWNRYKKIGLRKFSNVYLCTDLPEIAKDFFEV